MSILSAILCLPPYLVCCTVSRLSTLFGWLFVHKLLEADISESAADLVKQKINFIAREAKSKQVDGEEWIFSWLIFNQLKS